MRPDDGIRAFLRRLSAGPVARMDAGISYAAQTDLLARGWITLHTILVAARHRRTRASVADHRSRSGTKRGPVIRAAGDLFQRAMDHDLKLSFDHTLNANSRQRKLHGQDGDDLLEEIDDERMKPLWYPPTVGL